MIVCDHHDWHSLIHALQVWSIGACIGLLGIGEDSDRTGSMAGIEAFVNFESTTHGRQVSSMINLFEGCEDCFQICPRSLSDFLRHFT